MKTKLKQIFALIISVCSVLAFAIAFSACGNREKYCKISLDTSGGLPEEILSVELSVNMTDGNGVQHYIVTAEEGKNFVYLNVRCKIGYEPDFYVQTNGGSLRLKLNREQVILEEDMTVGRYSLSIDTSKLSGDEVLKLEGRVKDAYYPVSLTVNDTSVPMLGDYGKFSVTINGMKYGFDDFIWYDNPKKVIVPHGKPITVTVKIEGKAFTQNDGNYICSPVWSNYEQVFYDNGELFKVEGDSISYRVILRGTGTIFLDLAALNNIYE